MTKPRLLVLNQYYWPGVEATAHLLTELCEALTDEYDVTVVTGVLHGHEGGPRREERNGVRIVRVPSTSFERSRLLARGTNYVTYLANTLVKTLGEQPPALVLCMTDPPMVGALGVGVARHFRAPLVVISEDVFPEIATELGRLESRALVAVLRQLVNVYLHRADRIVAIGETMRQKLIEKGAPEERITVIPNWVDTAALTPQPRDNAWAREHGLEEKFVVMHSGNVGHAQDLDSLVRAFTFLRDLDDVRLVVIGAGARHAELVALAERLEVEIRFLPYQPRERLAESLSAADLHVVGLARGLSGFVVPSRMYGVLAVGRPVIVAADAESETARIVQETGCGLVVPPGRPELLAEAIRSAHDGELDLAEMGLRGRAYAETEADRTVAIGRYRSVLAEVVK